VKRTLQILLLAAGMLFIGCTCDEQPKPNPITPIQPAPPPQPEEPKPEPQPPKEEPAEDVTITVHFAFDSSKLEISEQDGLRQEIILRKKDSPVSIIGHADSQGPEDYNMKLSARRAVSVSNYLKSLGIENVWTAKGEEQLLNADKTAADHQANRRAEISFKVGL